jgi:hypothetical protein
LKGARKRGIMIFSRKPWMQVRLLLFFVPPLHPVPVFSEEMIIILEPPLPADEPTKPFDELDDGARGLLDSILERQAYIGAGLIDPEGFDDFRVVIGENSLAPSGAAAAVAGRPGGE